MCKCTAFLDYEVSLFKYVYNYVLTSTIRMIELF